MRKTIYICDICGREDTEATGWFTGLDNKDWCLKCWKIRDMSNALMGSTVIKATPPTYREMGSIVLEKKDKTRETIYWQ